MNYLITFLIFLLSSNVFLLLLIKLGIVNKINNTLLILSVYGLGPFIFALIYYLIIFLFPGGENIFYSKIIIGICLIVIISCKSCLSIIIDFQTKLLSSLYKEVKRYSILIVVLATCFIGIYSVQLAVFPIVDNDSVLYLDQTEAFHKYKNVNWQNIPNIFINGSDSYEYNSSIRPGIPAILSMAYLFQGIGRYDLASYRYLSFYYYFLLLAVYLYSVWQVTVSLKFNSKRSVTYSILFFIFSWSLTRSYIFGTKELIIYFLALLSILFTNELMSQKTNRWQIGILLGTVLGINTFINLHGIIIECLILLILFLLSKTKILQRIFEIILIFVVSIPCGGFEFINYFGFIFLSTVISVPLSISSRKDIAVHQSLYQINDFQSQYLKGKMQILTNIGVFGFYPWMFLLTLGKYFKIVMSNNLLKLIIYFIALYYLVVIDPLSLSKHPLSIVLWGSTKYAALLLFLCMTVLGVFIDRLILWATEFIEKHRYTLLIFGVIFGILFTTQYSNLINLGTKILFLSIPIFKDVSFYRNTVETFIVLLMIMNLIFVVSMLVSLIFKKTKLTYYLVNMIVMFLILTPFFITNVGKISFKDEIKYFSSDNKTKLENMIDNGDILKTYYKDL